jgi:hypothetical protein
MSSGSKGAQGGERRETMIAPTSSSDGNGLVHHAYHAARRAINEYREVDE